MSAPVGPPDPSALSCETRDGCVTCSDAATVMRVLALAPPLEPARCLQANGEIDMVLLDLVDAEVGDEVLVHAGVAIGRAAGAEGSP